MSAKTLAKIARHARDVLIDIAWRQWAAIGASPANGKTAQSVVDPEALLLISLLLKEDERRLWDVVAGWAEHWARLLSVQRTNNLAQAYGENAQRTIQEFANFASVDASDARWRHLAGKRAAPKPRKHVTTPPSLQHDSAVILRLRLGLGVGMRADVLGYLLTAAGTSVSVRDVSSSLDYTGPATRRVLDDLATARMLTVNAHKRPAQYSVDAKVWGQLLRFKSPVPVWRYWHQVFLLLYDITTWANAARGKTISAFALEALGWQTLEKHKDAFLWNEHPFDADPERRPGFAATILEFCDWARRHT